jgi:hypothetical protein
MAQNLDEKNLGFDYMMHVLNFRQVVYSTTWPDVSLGPWNTAQYNLKSGPKTTASYTTHCRA